MKNIIILLILFSSISSFSQSPNDSAYTKNLALRASTVAFLIPKTLDPANDSLYTVFIKWRASLRANPVGGNTTITIDTIPTVELANLYGYVLQLPAGLDILPILRSQFSAARAANPYLQRLCTAIDDSYASQLQNMILIGRKLLLGR